MNPFLIGVFLHVHELVVAVLADHPPALVEDQDGRQELHFEHSGQLGRIRVPQLGNLPEVVPKL